MCFSRAGPVWQNWQRHMSTRIAVVSIRCVSWLWKGLGRHWIDRQIYLARILYVSLSSFVIRSVTVAAAAAAPATDGNWRGNSIKSRSKDPAQNLSLCNVRGNPSVRLFSSIAPYEYHSEIVNLTMRSNEWICMQYCVQCVGWQRLNWSDVAPAFVPRDRHRASLASFLVAQAAYNVCRRKSRHKQI